MFVKRHMENNKEEKVVLIKGESGTRKTALAIEISKNLGNTHFTTLSGTEKYSLEKSKSEAITQEVRESEDQGESKGH